MYLLRSNKTCGLLALCAFLTLASPTYAKPHARHRHKITVTPADAPAIKKAIASYKGNVVVVNFWATWCVTCVAEFPALVRLQNRYRADGLTVIAVSVDSVHGIPKKVKPFLRKQRAYFPQFIVRANDPGEFINAIDPKWQGDVPRTLIYNRAGHLVKVLNVPQTDKSFAAAVKPLLAASR